MPTTDDMFFEFLKGKLGQDRPDTRFVTGVQQQPSFPGLEAPRKADAPRTTLPTDLPNVPVDTGIVPSDGNPYEAMPPDRGLNEG